MTDTDQPTRDLLLEALDEARSAQAVGDHPYGSVLITADGSKTPERNRVESTPDPTAHSEIMALRTAALASGLDSLRGATLYTSSEPCPMCCGAILESGVSRLVISNRRTVGEPPLGDYSVEGLLAMLGRSADMVVETVPLPQIAAFYA